MTIFVFPKVWQLFPYCDSFVGLVVNQAAVYGPGLTLVEVDLDGVQHEITVYIEEEIAEVDLLEPLE